MSLCIDHLYIKTAPAQFFGTMDVDQEGISNIELLNCLFKNDYTRPYIGKVCALDELPSTRNQNERIYIVNTEDSTMPGEHWVAIYLEGDIGYFFDPMGKELEEYDPLIKAFIEENTDCWDENYPEQYQPDDSDLCGEYCLYFALCMCMGEPYERLKKHFNLHYLGANDHMIVSAMSTYYDHVVYK